MDFTKLINILKVKSIRVVNKKYVKLDDLLTKIIQTKNPTQYIKRNIKEQYERNGFIYICLDECYELLNKTNKKEAKDILNEFNKNNEVSNGNMLIDLKNNILRYKNKDVMIIKIKDDIWFKGKDVAEILEYEDTVQTIEINVNEDDKQNYDKICKLFGNVFHTPPKSQDKKTIFINESGLYSLILSSKKPEAKHFKHWITSEVLPSIRKYGTYIMPNFYETNLISDYDNKNVIYIGDIGVQNNEQLYKFGKTSNIFTRDYNQHKKTFDKFDIIHIVECDNKDTVEQLFKKELTSKQLLRDLTINQKKQTELFATTNAYNINSIINMLKELVIKYPLQAIADKDREHKEIILKNEYDKDLLIEREKTKQKELELKIKIEDRKTKELELKILELSTKTQCIDIYKQYLDERTKKNNKHIHTSVLYDDFKKWFNSNNPNSKMPSNKEFVKEIRKYYEVFDNVRVDGKNTTGIKNLQIICNN